jgi:hypothetical protein
MLAGVLVAVVAGGGWAAARGGLLDRPAAATPTTEVPTGTATVTRTEVVERQQVAGTLGYGDSVTVPGQSQGDGGSSGGGSGAGGGGQGRRCMRWTATRCRCGMAPGRRGEPSSSA